MDQDFVEVNLRFEPFQSFHADLVGIYVRTLKHYDETIDYVGIAGFKNATFGTRLHQHHQDNVRAKRTYLKFEYHDQMRSTFEDYLQLYQRVALNFSNKDIFVPGMKQSYPENQEEAARRAADTWNYYVAPMNADLPRLETAFGDRRAALCAVEAKLQTLLRSFYVQVSGNDNFPVSTYIPAQPGDDASTRSYLFGQTHSGDLTNSDSVILKSMELTFTTRFAAAFTGYVNGNNRLRPARRKNNPLIYE